MKKKLNAIQGEIIFFANNNQVGSMKKKELPNEPPPLGHPVINRTS